jgi:hypothetical protein
MAALLSRRLRYLILPVKSGLRPVVLLLLSVVISCKAVLYVVSGGIAAYKLEGN